MPHSFQPAPENARDFRQALGQYATGVTVVTTLSPLGPLGITANSFASVSLDPPLVLWSPARASRRFDAFAAAEHYVIHVLSAEQDAICQRFSRDGLNFDGLDWAPDAHGSPVLHGCCARFTCRQHAQFDGGDHLVILGEVQDVQVQPGAPLIFHDGQYGRLHDRA